MPDPLVEIHYHILPGVDDGAPDLTASLAMARQAAEEGIGTIVATPHSPWRGQPQRRRTAQAMEPLVAEVNALLRAHAVPVEVLPGAEVLLEPELPRLIDEGLRFTLAGSRTLLVELPFSQFPAHAEQTLFELQLRGLRVVMAHPERNIPIQRDPWRFLSLVERGVLGQLTGRSLRGDYGPKVRRTAHLLLEHNLVHVLASDVHGVGAGRPGLREGIRLAAEVVGQERAWAMATEAPRRLLADEEIPIPEPLALERLAPSGRGWWN